MASKNISSPVGLCKVITVVLGFIVLVIGCVSHFQSTWTKKSCGMNFCTQPYEICRLPGIKNCPAIEMERYYVSMIIICFFLSLIGLVATFLVDTSSRTFKLVDLGYHAISTLLLIIAAIVYLISAEQIHKLYPVNKTSFYNFRRPEKLAAGSLTIFQAIAYGVVTLLIARGRET